MASLATWLAWPYVGRLSLLLPIVLVHFFLFCNVFRVRRKLELLWAVLFVVNVAVWTAVGDLDCWWVLAIQLPVTVAVIMTEIRSEQYHGVFCRRAGEELMGGSPPLERPCHDSPGGLTGDVGRPSSGHR